MQLECPACRHLLEFSAEPPSFCAYCGKRIGEAKGKTTINYDPEAATQAPSEASGIPGAVPESVGGYRILRSLGQGGMGTVYEAEDASSGCHVALKLIAPEFATSRDAVERFRQEGRLASAIAHPRCVFVFAVDEQAGQPYIAMELMPGTTLQDVVKERGPLALEEAIAKILDVIDGLEEVHRLGVVHRDIKPSNCFLEADGRVKIGDFGLSKSLVTVTHLTKTGLFLGTPLYASPEQIKMERVDHQSDLYAVAATLYFLLTGRAPHQTGDTTATLARIISDPVPCMRVTRPNLPAELDRVVLRGLERERKHRWKTLEEFRVALAPFVRRQFPIGSVGLRVGAYFIDLLLFYVLAESVKTVLGLQTTNTTEPQNMTANAVRLGMTLSIAEDIVWILYFTLLEGVWGCSLGKRLLRLRVCSTANGAHLGLGRALGRTLIFHVLVNLGWPIASILPLAYVTRRLSWVAFIALEGAIVTLWPVVGIGIVASTMRKRHSYRALHDLLSGSRVVRLPWTARQRKWLQGPQELGTSRPEGLPERIDQFTIKGAMRWTAQESMLLAEDTVLNRKVWLWLRPRSGAPLSETRRRIARPARLRWLDSGQAADRQWDAFLAAPAGWTLPNLLALMKQLSWAEARPLLEQLTEELVAASRDGTLPCALAVDRIWVQANGRVQLLETCLDDGVTKVNGSAGSEPRAALSLLREAVLLALEGRTLTAGTKTALRAPVPEHAVPMLNRLLEVNEPSFDSVEEFRAELASTQDKPAEITTAQRGAHLTLLAGAMLFPLLWMFVITAVLPVIVKCTTILNLNEQIQDQQRILIDFQGEMRRDFLFALLQPDPLARAYSAVRLHADMNLGERLERRIEEKGARETSLRQSAGWMASLWLQDEGSFQRGFQRSREHRPSKVTKPSDRDSRQSAQMTLGIVERGYNPMGWRIYLIFVALVPLIWVLWAFLLRGGFTYRLAGIALLRANGRKALRIQCAWRALLVWAPVAVLLVLCCWLNDVWLVAWDRQNMGSLAWASWLAWVCWSLALALLPLYVGLALWLPNRSLHDRLAVTYLVPR
jgi:hypothetical protein